jgi:predicted nucleic acid-binding Zn ribbon protein
MLSRLSYLCLSHPSRILTSETPSCFAILTEMCGGNFEEREGRFYVVVCSTSIRPTGLTCAQDCVAVAGQSMRHRCKRLVNSKKKWLRNIILLITDSA